MTTINPYDLPASAWVPKIAVELLYRAVGTRTPSDRWLWAQLEDRELWLLYTYADAAQSYMHFAQWLPVLRQAGRELARRQGEKSLEDAAVRAVRSHMSAEELIEESLAAFSGSSPGFDVDKEFDN